MADEVTGIFQAKVSPATLERSPGELDDVERGTLFVPWPKPPRVGERVQIDLAFGEDAPERLTALVVAARTSRGPVTAGFKASLERPKAELLARLQRIAETARSRIVARAVERREGVELSPVVERTRPRARAPARTEEASAAETLPNLPDEPGGIELPEDDGSVPFELSDQPAAIEPAARAEPDRPARRTFDLTLDPMPEPAPEPVFLRTPTPGPAGPWRVEISSGKSYLVHFSRFFWQGEVYLARTPAPEPESVIEVEIAVPDGRPPLMCAAIVDREIAPPEVPRAGFVAKLVDLDGAHAQRLKEAAIRFGD